MKKFSIFNFQFSIILLYFLFLTSPAYGAANIPFPPPPAGPGVNIGDKFGFGDIRSLGDATSKLVTPLFSIAAFLVVLYFLLGAFKYLKAGGNKEDTEGARQMISHAMMGFVILMLAFLVLQFLLSSLFKTEFRIF